MKRASAPYKYQEPIRPPLKDWKVAQHGAEVVPADLVPAACAKQQAAAPVLASQIFSSRFLRSVGLATAQFLELRHQKMCRRRIADTSSEVRGESVPTNSRKGGRQRILGLVLRKAAVNEHLSRLHPTFA